MCVAVQNQTLCFWKVFADFKIDEQIYIYTHKYIDIETIEC